MGGKRKPMIDAVCIDHGFYFCVLEVVVCGGPLHGSYVIVTVFENG